MLCKATCRFGRTGRILQSCRLAMTTVQAAQALNITSQTVRNLMRNGKLQGEKRGRSFWIDPSSVSALPAGELLRARAGRQRHRVHRRLGQLVRPLKRIWALRGSRSPASTPAVTGGAQSAYVRASDRAGYLRQRLRRPRRPLHRPRADRACVSAATNRMVSQAMAQLEDERFTRPSRRAGLKFGATPARRHLRPLRHEAARDHS